MAFRQHSSPSLTAAVLLSGLFWAGCDSVSDSNSGASDEWLIPRFEVVDGGPGKDGIPSVDNPKFTSAQATSYVPDNRRVVGIRIGNDIRAYPHQVLDWHEIVNDRIGSTSFALTYCPLTGTGTAWNRIVDGQETEFGVSGRLFKNNMIPYDRATDSNWSQMQLRSVNGAHAGRDVETYQVVETTWATWKSMYPDSQVLTLDTGFNRRYDVFTYGERYSTDPNQILFPVRNPDNRLGNKERVHGIIPDEGLPVVFPIRQFGDGVRVITDTVGGTEYVVAGSQEHDFAVAFERPTSLEFTAVQDALPVVLEDSEGNRWDVFGVAVSGPRAGQRLAAATSYTGYWFGWADFFPGLDIREN